MRKLTKQKLIDGSMAVQLEEAAMGGPAVKLAARELLKNLELPATPEGAREALVLAGRWSGKEGGEAARDFQPWSAATLEAASSFKEATLLATPEKGRDDFRPLDAYAIDGARTAFRDDAVGLRERDGEIVKGKNRWEVVVHVADVSAVYCGGEGEGEGEKERGVAEELRRAARERSFSRYDLNFGPLHMLPPKALQALSLTTGAARPCVTVVAYIDEETGRLLDARVARTVVNVEDCLSHEAADALLDEGRGGGRAAEALGTVEKLLRSWQENRKATNSDSKKRSDKLNTRAASRGSGSVAGNDGAFARTRSHLLVDASLELYSTVIMQKMVAANAQLAMLPGAGIGRAGRAGTAPLRRFVDGVAQRQVLTALCGYGGEPLSREECREISEEAGRVRAAWRKEGSK